jgi:hypothetical protein
LKVWASKLKKWWPSSARLDGALTTIGPSTGPLRFQFKPIGAIQE